MPRSTLTELHSRAALVSHLRDLYPHLTHKDVERKIAASTTAFRFFRSFIPYFYDMLRRMHVSPDFPDLHGMDVIEGWCVGDAHPENFGAIYCKSGRVGEELQFTMNDPDDGGPGPLYADLLRFFTAIRLHNPGLSLDPVINAYRQGLDGDWEFSPVVARELDIARRRKDRPERLFRRRAKGGLKPRKKTRSRFTFQKKISRQVRETLVSGVENLVGGSYRICRLWSLKKKGGGSGGLRRYWVVLAPRKRKRVCRAAHDKKMLILELKALSKPGLYPLQCSQNAGSGMACSDEPATIMNRVGETLDLERGLAVTRFCDVVRFGDLPPMLVRVRWGGNRGVELDEGRYTHRELTQLLKDEAKVLGHIHRKSLPAGNRYGGHVYALAPAIGEAADLMESAFRTAYEVLALDAC